MPTSIPPSGNGAPCWIRLFLTKVFAESPSWITLNSGAQIPGFRLFWWRLMSLGLLAMSGLQVWSHAHSVGEKRLSKISLFILLYWRHEVSRGWVSDMWYQPRWKWWELMALNTYRDWLLHLCRWCLIHVSEVHLNLYLLQMTVSTPSSAQHSSCVVQVSSELHTFVFPHHRLDIPMHTHIGWNFSV